MKDSSIPLTLFASCLLSVCACSCAAAPVAPSSLAPTAAAQQVAEHLPPPVRTADPIDAEISKFRGEIARLFTKRNFSELEKVADDIIKSKARFGSGSWKITQFYKAFELRTQSGAETFRTYDLITQEWIAAYPKSVIPRIASANYYISYAWNARSPGSADTVSNEGAKLFEERLAKAAFILNEAATLEPKCPVWWYTMMTVALGQEWKRADYDKLFKEAKSFEPEFWGYDVAKQWYLMPRWHGKPGDWEDAAEADANAPDGLGAEGYARVVLAASEYYKNVFKETKASWPLTRKGFEILRQKYPDSLFLLDNFCYLACRAEDRALAKQLFQQINGRPARSLWGQDIDFTTDQTWANSGN